MRQRHSQALQLGAAGQQLSLQLVPLRLNSLRLRLQAGQLHWEARRDTFEGKQKTLFEHDLFIYCNLEGALCVGSTQQLGEMDFASPSKISGDGDGRKRESERERERR